MEKLVQHRQGDVFFEKVVASDILGSDKARVIEDGVIAEGEATGHSHQLSGEAVLYDYRGVMYAHVTGPAWVVHEEHGSIPLDIGDWMFTRQREERPFGSSLVAD